jgi:hypothetical protein
LLGAATATTLSEPVRRFCEKKILLLMLAKTLDYAWAAGFFDGEGCIRVDKQSRAKSHGYNSTCTQITLTQKGTDTEPPDILVKFANLFPGGKIYREKGRALWRYTISKKWYVKAALKSMLPWFGERRSAKAHECIRAIMNSPYKVKP